MVNTICNREMPGKKLLTALAVSVLIGASAQADASYLTSTFVNNTLNTYEDNSREAYVDVNANGLFDVGDVIIGFARIEAQTVPAPGADVQNHVWAIFSQQIESIGPDTSTGPNVYFKPTTVAGLTLDDLIGPGTAGANDMVAMFSSNTALTNLTLTSPGDVTGSDGITLADYFAYILANTTLDFLAGRVDNVGGAAFCQTTDGSNGDDCFSALSSTLPLSTSTIALSNPALSGASFGAGLEVTLDPAGWNLLDLVLANNPAGGALWLTLAEFAVSGGTATGALGAVNASEWTNVAGLGSFTQCDVDPIQTGIQSGPCGFINNLDWGIHPQQLVPEPSALALLGAGLLGFGATRIRRRRS